MFWVILLATCGAALYYGNKYRQRLRAKDGEDDREDNRSISDNETCAACGVDLTAEDLEYDGGRKDFCRDCG